MFGRTTVRRRHLRWRVKKGMIVALLCLTPLLAAVAAGVTGPDPRIEQCGGGGNRVTAAFDLPRAADFWDYFPAAGRAPELENDFEGAFVVRFEDGFIPPIIHGIDQADAPTTLNGVVCVVPASGWAHLYYDISFDGARSPE